MNNQLPILILLMLYATALSSPASPARPHIIFVLFDDQGYNEVNWVNGNEKKYFNVLCRGSALRYLLTRAYDYLNTPKNAIIKIKDPKEYIKKLNFHRQVKSYNNYIN